MRASRSIEEVAGPIIYVTDGATGVKVKGYRYWLNRPRVEFEDARTPKRGEVWRFTYEAIDRADGDVVRFVREEERLEDAEEVPSQLTMMERPNFEDAEWFWAIRDERGGVFKGTYQEYIESEAWRRRADQRLALDGHKCTANLPGCTIGASQVHHVTYSHLGCEPMWDLMSVCGNCHALLTSMDKKQPAKAA